MSVSKKILSLFLCILSILCCFSGCQEDYSDAYIYFELAEQPKTLDPQTASSDSELLITRNIYEGLLRQSSDGTIVNGVCDSYSYQNLTYTFNLKSDAVWSNGDKVTAYDFEYAFKRAVNPKTNSPFVSRLFAITNAEAISTGVADISTLGVTAIDSTTLTISMCREDEDFLKTLTTSVCMPCNEDFFENSIGKYGLDAEYIISNGSYRLSKWNKEDFGIRLYKNEKYSGKFVSENGAVFISCVNDETQVSRLADGDSDMAFISCSELDTAKNHFLKTDSVQNICWVLTVNSNYSQAVRNAFASAFSAEVYNSSLPSGFSVAKSIYPPVLNINTENIGLTDYNIDYAKTLMSAQISGMDNSKFPQTTLYYYDIDGIKNLATAIVGHWQQNLSTFINIESSNNLNELQKEISESSLDFALFPITAKSESYEEYAKNFGDFGSEKQPETLQQELLGTNCIIPVAYQTTNISYINSLENVTVFDDNGYIDFSYIIKR